MKKLNKKGFTIVELVIVIAVIAILAAVLIPTFSGIIDKANESAAKQELVNAYKEAYALALADDGKIVADTDTDEDGDVDAEVEEVGEWEFAFTEGTDGIEVELIGYPTDFKYTNSTFANGEWTLAEADEEEE